jgi:hypothetical protein
MHGRGHPTSTHKTAFLRDSAMFACAVETSREVIQTMTAVLGPQA